jgi:hypothetical protein
MMRKGTRGGGAALPRAALAAAVLVGALLGVSGCAPAAPSSPQLLEVQSVAAESSDVEGTVDAVDCWDPESHIVDPATDAEVFRVLCRVHYDQAGTERWRDMTCIGDLAGRPVLEYCYPWLPYDGVPTFEDGA